MGNIKIIREKNCVSWCVTGRLTYGNIIRFIEKTSNDRYLGFGEVITAKIKRLAYLKREDVEEYLNILQDRPFDCDENPLYLEGNSYKRLIIYALCAILGLECETWEVKDRRVVDCNEFHPDGNECGCDYVPRKYERGYVGTDIRRKKVFFSVPWTYKIGVVVY